MLNGLRGVGKTVLLTELLTVPTVRATDGRPGRVCDERKRPPRLARVAPSL